MSRKIVLGLVAAAGVLTCGFLIAVMALQGLSRAGAWAGPLAALAGIGAAVAAVYGPLGRPSKAPLPPELEIPGWVVGRPAELDAVVKALVDREAGTVGITTGLYGAGGFGKTTLARMVSADPRVRRQFGGRVYLVTMGRDVRGPTAVAAKVNEVIKFVFDEDVTFTDPQLAGRRLGSLLAAGPRRLLVLDDVWQVGQLDPFTEGGGSCARLVTTRVPELLAGRGATVRVDQMSHEQAQALLTGGLPPLDPEVVAGLLAVTGRWPLLLRLVNKILADHAGMAPDVSAQGAALVERLRVAGPAAVDDLLGQAVHGLDVDRPEERARAVRATIGASTSLLAPQDAKRFGELGMFAEDETVPFGLVTRMWRATAGLDELAAGQVCNRLAQLALVAEATAPGGGLTMHDVVRDFVRAELGPQRLAELNDMLLDAIGANLPAAKPLGTAAGPVAQVAWWKLSPEDRYLWDHLVEHLVDTGRPNQAEAVAGDLRWVGARLERFGPAAPAADLSTAATPRTARLLAVLTRAAHLLAPTEPPGAVVDILHSRVAEDPDWGPQVTALRDVCPRPRLINRWPVPDLAHLAMRRVLTGHTGAVTAVAVAPDGNWLAYGGMDGRVRIWDVATGRERAPLATTAGEVTAVAVAPDGRWLASGGRDGTVRIWDVASGRERATLAGHDGWIEAVVVAPDGSWLASAGWDGTVRIWDVASGRVRATLAGQAGRITAVAIAPDGSWLASVGGDATVRIWDAATGQERTTLAGHIGPVMAVAIAPDGSWLASGQDRKMRIWDAATGQERTTLAGHIGPVMAVAIAPDGSWLASGGRDGTVRIWDAATGQERATLTGHASWVEAVAVAPDGTWLASGGRDGTVRIWDVPICQEPAKLFGPLGPVTAVAVAADCGWIVSGSESGIVRIWDIAIGQPWGALTPEPDYFYQVKTVAVAPDCSWLASGGDDGIVRIWDVGTGKERLTMLPARDHAYRVTAVAVAPDGSWLAYVGWQGLQILDMTPGNDQITQIGNAENVTAVAVAPDGSWLASGGWHGLRIWDVATGEERATLAGNSSYIETVAAAPDGTWLVSGGVDGMVRIWDVATGHQRAALAGHDGPVTAVTVAADGNWLASGGGDGTVRIWDVAALETRAQMRIDGGVNVSQWLGSDALAVGGSAGLYLFSFLTGPTADAH